MISYISPADRDNSEENPTPNPVTPEVDAKGTPKSPSEVVAGAQTGQELLRRLSLGQDKQDVTNLDPRVAHPNLHLTGSIINVAFCLPYDIGFAPDLDWASLPPVGSRFDTNILLQ